MLWKVEEAILELHPGTPLNIPIQTALILISKNPSYFRPLTQDPVVYPLFYVGVFPVVTEHNILRLSLCMPKYHRKHAVAIAIFWSWPKVH